MIISIFASIGAQNLGDELILKNEIEILRERYKSSLQPHPRALSLEQAQFTLSPQGEGVAASDLKFVVFTYDVENPFYTANDVEYREYFPIESKKIKNIFRNIRNFFVFLAVVIKSDLIVIGGGGIIYDREKQLTKSPLDSWVFRTNIFRLFFKKFSFFAIGINIDESNQSSMDKLKKIFKKASKVEVRDEYSKDVLKKIDITSEIILDPVFYDKGFNVIPAKAGISENDRFLPSQEGQKKRQEGLINKSLCLNKIYSKDFTTDDLEGINFNGKKVAIAFRKGYISKVNSPELEILIVKEIIEYIQNLGAKVILLPHSFHKTDILANDYEWMKLILEKTSNVDITHSMQETYEVYKDKKIDICLAERFHSIILSNVYNIEFVALSYSKKTHEILKEF